MDQWQVVENDAQTKSIYLKPCLYQTHLTSKEIVAETVKINVKHGGLFVCDNVKPEMIQDLEQEYLTYLWRMQKSTGKTLDGPEDSNVHCIDALVYAVRDMERKQVEYGAVRF